MNIYKYKTDNKSKFNFNPVLTTLILAIVLFLSSCVGQKKYDNVLNDVAQLKASKQVDSLKYAKKLENQNAVIMNQLYSLNTQNKMLNEKLDIIDSMKNILSAEKAYLINTRKVINDLKTKDWEVEQVNGMLMIELDDNILFETGSTRISKNGLALIKDISTVVNNGIDDDVKIWVAGHTDDKQYTTEDFNNWDLSAQRALAVVKEMENNELEPWKLTALARSMYSPQVPNRNKDLRSQNRRTEIFLIPASTSGFANIKDQLLDSE